MREIASNKEWKKWGETDPLFGVATWQNKNKGGANPWTDEDFYKFGESDWKDFRRHWERYGVNNESCLEIGCGAGRITMQLATYFNEVYALDVSEKMIEYAKKHIKSPSVVFHVSNGTDIPLGDQSVFSVFSTHVFQHFDSLSVANMYFAEIARVLKADGSLMIHLPVYKWPVMPKAFSQLYAIRKRVEDMRAHVRRLLMQYGMAKPIMRGLRYPVDFFYEVLPELGFDDIEISIFVTKSNNDPHSFVFARKKT
jgi:ubiquinone/menaquinone biosynthesis C-methylase UbiE